MIDDNLEELLYDIRKHVSRISNYGISEYDKALMLAAKHRLSIICVPFYYDKESWDLPHNAPYDEIRWYALRFDTSMYTGMWDVADYNYLYVREEDTCDTPLQAVKEAITRYEEWNKMLNDPENQPEEGSSLT